MVYINTLMISPDRTLRGAQQPVGAGWRPSATGQLLSFDDSGKQPSERLLYFASCQRANAHNSAKADGELHIRDRPLSSV
jgi:hypothetical protein